MVANDAGVNSVKRTDRDSLNTHVHKKCIFTLCEMITHSA